MELPLRIRRLLGRDGWRLDFAHVVFVVVVVVIVIVVVAGIGALLCEDGRVGATSLTRLLSFLARLSRFASRFVTRLAACFSCELRRFDRFADVAGVISGVDSSFLVRLLARWVSFYMASPYSRVGGV